VSIKHVSGSGLYTGAKGAKLWDQTTVQNDFQSIATVVVPSGGQATVTFSNIPQNFTHLQLRVVGRCTGAYNSNSNVFIYFNGDTTVTDYYSHGFYGTGAANGVYVGNTPAYAMQVPDANTTANVFGGGIIDFLDYANASKNKVARSLSGFDQNQSPGVVTFTSVGWYKAGTGSNISDPISSITLTPQDGNWAQFSQAALYGIKAAS